MEGSRPVHGVEQVQGAGHVGLVVPQRLLGGLTHSLQTREVNHGVGANLLEEGLHTLQVEQINPVGTRERGRPAR